MDRLLLLAMLATFCIAVGRPHFSAARWQQPPETPPIAVDVGLLARDRAALDSLAIRTACLLIDVDACRFRLYDAQRQLLLDGPCATGKDSSLTAPDGRRWQFTTPRGLRRVHHKSADPIWAKPDWYYLEEGLPLPPAGDPSRLAPGMLGAFALDVGQGYLVHGSPYQRGIGERITHGCVRLADADLKRVYDTLAIGDAVVLR